MAKDNQNLKIVGYSYGSLIAIELMRALESKGLNGQLILIDGSPDFTKNLKINSFGYNSSKNFYNNILINIMEKMFNIKDPKYFEAVSNCNCWDDKIEMFLNKCPRELSDVLSRENQKLLITAYLTRTMTLDDYDISQLQPIKAHIILIKPTIETMTTDSEDYGLSKVTKGKVEVHYAEGDHLTILHNEKVADIINGDPIA